MQWKSLSPLPGQPILPGPDVWPASFRRLTGLSSTGQASVYLPPSSLRLMHALHPPWELIPCGSASFYSQFSPRCLLSSLISTTTTRKTTWAAFCSATQPLLSAQKHNIYTVKCKQMHCNTCCKWCQSSYSTKTKLCSHAAEKQEVAEKLQIQANIRVSFGPCFTALSALVQMEVI